MPKDKRPKTTKDKTKADQHIEDALASAGRGDLKEVIRIGQLVEDTLKGEFGSVLRALLRGRSAADLAESRRSGGLSSDRYLGRLDAYERILEDLEQFVTDKDIAAQKLIDDSKPQPEDIETAPELGQKETVHA